jgi:hypothetical protein
MWHEISQYDIPDRQLLATKAQSNMGRRKDLGEAKITHTIFGKARVRIIREQDKIRRARLLMALAVVALAAASWQGWIVMNRTAPPPLSTRIQVSAPAFQPEYLPAAVAPSSVVNKPGMASQTGTITRTTDQKSATPQVRGLKVSEQIVAKPVASEPLVAGKPQTASPATNINSSKNRTDIQQLPRQSAPMPPAIPFVKAAVVTQPAASSTAVVAPPDSPLVKGVTSTTPLTGINQPSSSVNAQSN